MQEQVAASGELSGGSRSIVVAGSEIESLRHIDRKEPPTEDQRHNIGSSQVGLIPRPTMVLASLCFNPMGDGNRYALDPRQHRR